MRRLTAAATALGVSWVLAGCGAGDAPKAAHVPSAPVPSPVTLTPMTSAPVPATPAAPVGVANSAAPVASPVSTVPAPSTTSATSVDVSPPRGAATPSASGTSRPHHIVTAAPAPARSAPAARAPSPPTKRRTPTPTKPAKPKPPKAPKSKADVVTARPGMNDPRPARWERVEVLTQRKLRVYFTSGVAPCDVLDSVRVDYRPDTVVVTLYTGSDPAHADRVCAAMASPKAVDVRLAKRLAGRTVVDGAQRPAAGPGATPTDAATQVSPTPDAVQTRPTSWDRAEELGKRTVRIYFTSGAAPCSVLSRVKVAYAADRVTITLITGRDRAAAGQACMTALRPVYVDVRLDEPLAGRRIVDGAA